MFANLVTINEPSGFIFNFYLYFFSIKILASLTLLRNPWNVEWQMQGPSKLCKKIFILVMGMVCDCRVNTQHYFVCLFLFGIRYSVLGIRYSVFGSVFGTRYSVFGTRYSVLGIRNSVCMSYFDHKLFRPWVISTMSYFDHELFRPLVISTMSYFDLNLAQKCVECC